MARDYHSVIECGHALGANRHGREVMQQGRLRAHHGACLPEQAVWERMVEQGVPH